jgi:hypothetical protein
MATLTFTLSLIYKPYLMPEILNFQLANPIKLDPSLALLMGGFADVAS